MEVDGDGNTDDDEEEGEDECDVDGDGVGVEVGRMRRRTRMRRYGDDELRLGGRRLKGLGQRTDEGLICGQSVYTLV